MTRSSWSVGWLALLWAAAWPAFAGRELVVAAESWPPYVFERKGTPAGFDYEVSRVILGRLGYDVSLRLVPWKRALVMAELREVDAVLGVGKGDQNERESFLDFPDLPLSGSRTTLFFLKSQPFRYEGLHSLRGKTVGVVLGYSYSPDFMYAPYFNRETVNTHELNLRKLLSRRIDLAVINTAVGLYSAREMGVADQLDFDPTPISGGRLYLAFAKKPELRGLAQAFGRAFDDFRKTREYQAILAQYGVTPALVAPDY